MPPVPGLLRRLLVLGALAPAVAGCSHVDRFSFAPAATTAPGPSTTTPATLPNGAGVRLRPVPGASTTTVAGALGGSAAISGTVLGPSGAVAGATVLAQRVVGAASVSVTAVTGPDGSFSLPGLLGGDYRVRAWEPPTLDLTAPVVFFLAGGALHTLTLSLTSFTTPSVAVALNPDPPVVGQPSSLAVQVATPAVGTDGVVRQTPLSGATVTLTNGPSWAVDGSQNPLTTGPQGEAVFEVTCGAPGAQPLDASVNGQAPAALSVPRCAAPPAPTTSAPTTSAPTATAAAPGG